MKIIEPTTGAICESLQGRDKGDLYCVTQVLRNGYLFVVDGDRKKLSCPKKKNLKHVHVFPSTVSEFGLDISSGKVSDSQIAFALKQFRQNRTKMSEESNV